MAVVWAVAYSLAASNVDNAVSSAKIKTLNSEWVISNKVDLDVLLMNFFIWKVNALFLRHLDFCGFAISKDFKSVSS